MTTRRATDNAKALDAYDFTRPTAVIMGNEHSGVSDELSRLADAQPAEVRLDIVKHTPDPSVSLVAAKYWMTA